MADLQICLLGTFQVCWDFAPVAPAAWRDQLAPRLLKLVLVRRPDPVPVEEAARLLGRHGGVLTALEQVNRVLHPAAALAEEGGLIRFEPDPACWIDLDAMLDQYRTGSSAFARGQMLPAIMAFQEADALYQGALLDEERQESWVLEPRRRVAELYNDILDRLAEGHAVLARYQDAVGFCHKSLAHDRLREATYQRLMVYYYYLGDLSAAADTYQNCQEALAGVGRTLSPATADLWIRLSHCELPGAPHARAAAARQDEPRRRPRKP